MQPATKIRIRHFLATLPWTLAVVGTVIDVVLTTIGNLIAGLPPQEETDNEKV